MYLLNLDALRKISKLLPAILFSTLGMCSYTVYPQVAPEKGEYAFGDGERLTYTVSYHWGIIWIDAGEVSFQAKKQKEDQPKGWHFISTGHSVQSLDWLFKVRDTFEVFSAASPFQPVSFRRNTSEGGHNVFNLYTFHPESQSVNIIARESRKAAVDTTLAFDDKITDVLTATYLTRSHNFKSMKPGESFNVSVLIDNKVTRLPIEYIGKDAVLTPNGLFFNCIRFSALISTGTLFSDNEQINVWVSDDENKIPVLIEAKIRVGSIKVHLSDFGNLHHPLTSFVPGK